MKRLVALSLVFLLVVTIIPSSTFSAFAQPQEKIPVILLFKQHDPEHHKAKIESEGGEIKTSYKIIHGYAAKLSRDAIEKLKNDPDIVSIDPDVQVKALDLGADTQIRADQVWAAGNTGQGVPVAILDTGIDTTHPEFSGRIIRCHSEITSTNACYDGNGHGTHVAGIVGAVGSNPSAKGVAPTASFYIDQVLDSTGSGTLSGIIAGIDWAVANNAKVISMSLGTSPVSTSQPNCDTTFPSLTTAVNNAVSSGLTVVAAAGNSGNQGVGAPGCISSTIAVGAIDSTDTIASFSSRGGSLADHGIVAPGVNVYSSVPTGSCQLCNPTGYATLSGTSMATPHVTGTIALMLKTNPSLTPSVVKNTLFNTACTQNTSPSCPTGTVPNNIYGHGRVDALSAFNAIANPPSPDFSISASPSSLSIQQGSTGTSSITVTSLNGYGSSVTLSLSGNPTGVGYSFSSNPVTPTASSALTLTVASTTNPGTYQLIVNGTDGTTTHTTIISLTVTQPTVNVPLSVSVSTDKSSYKLKSFAYITVTATDSSGPVAGASVTLKVTDPKNSVTQGSGTTNSNGIVVFKYRIGPNSTTGTYTAAAQVTAAGHDPGSGFTTFTVTK